MSYEKFSTVSFCLTRALTQFSPCFGLCTRSNLLHFSPGRLQQLFDSLPAFGLSLPTQPPSERQCHFTKLNLVLPCGRPFTGSCYPTSACYLDVPRALDNLPLCMSQPHLSPPFRPHPLTHPMRAAGDTTFPFPILISCISLSHFPVQPPPPCCQKHSLCFFPGGGICVSLPASLQGWGTPLGSRAAPAHGHPVLYYGVF